MESISKRKTLGIVREAYSKWERRSPLTPSQVSKLLRERRVDSVIVQPSTQRVFTDAEFSHAGALVQDDLSPCDAIVGVKQVERLLAEKTYAFFSHTIKAQEANMKLLDQVLAKNVRLVDHECVRSVESGQRLVAFGDFAGRAGMIETLRGLGLRLLGLGYSTPFLNIGPAYSYKNLNLAMQAVSQAANDFAYSGGARSFLPPNFGPLVFVFTGAGKVTRGAVEVFRGMQPVAEMLSSVDHLHSIQRSENMEKIFGIVIRDFDVLRNQSNQFERAEYYAHPERYDARQFATRVLPHASVVVTGAYWDARFPRWLPCSEEVIANSKKLFMISDVACDVKGSFEGLNRSTRIEDPFYYVDFNTRDMREVSSPNSEKDTNVKLVMGVDILPSELPREASEHFGECLYPFISSLCSEHHPEILQRATIAENGQLTERYKYIGLMREERKRKSSTNFTANDEAESAVIKLQGHLFDSRLINRTLDLIELKAGRFRIMQAVLAQPRGGPGREQRAHTTVLLEVVPSSLVPFIERLVKESPSEHEATMEILSNKTEVDLLSKQLERESKSKKEIASWTTMSGDLISTPAASTERIITSNNHHIVVFGAGLVSHPAIEYLLRNEKQFTIRIVSGDQNELNRISTRFANDSSRLEFICANIHSSDDVNRFINPETKCILSLLPAPLHFKVAQNAIANRVPLVTASYVGALKDLHDSALNAQVPILCEMGLDPGMDHMSAKKILAETSDRLIGFESFCGGLPAPECATNPLGYKLTWSPRGVLTALKQSAKYKENGAVHTIREGGLELMQSAKPFQLSGYMLPSLNLEFYPNRDSTQYAQVYGIPQAQTIFRGTLRYRGFSEVMLDFIRNGWLNDDANSGSGYEGKTWREVIDSRTFSERGRAFLENYANDRIVYSRESKLDSLCTLFKETLAMQANDRDLVLMEHRFRFADGSKTTSTFVQFGDDRDSAMSKTVGMTAAIGVSLLLEGLHPRGGIHLPTSPWVYEEALKRLEKNGIVFHKH